MIKDYFETDDEQHIKWLTALDDLIKSDLFLKAVGVNAAAVSQQHDFKIITDMDKAYEMMCSQEVWDLPEPWPFQYFPGVLEFEVGRLAYKNGLSDEERRRIHNLEGKQYDNFKDYIKQIILEKGKHEGVCDLYGHSRGEEILYQLSDYISYIVTGILYAHLEGSPIYYRFFQAFQTGGFPCAWVGEAPEDGGKAEDCLQIFYLGK